MSENKEARKLQKKLESAEGLTRVNILEQLTRVLDTVDLAAARSYAEEAVALARDLVSQAAGDDAAAEQRLSALASALHTQGACLIKSGSFAECVPTLRESATLFEKVGNGREAAEALTSLGAAYSQDEKYAPAITALESARDLGDAAELPPGRQVMIYAVLTIAYVHVDRQEESKAALRRTEELAALAGDLDSRMLALDTAASVTTILGDFAASIETLAELLALVRPTGKSYDLLMVLNHLTIALEARNEYQRSLQCTEEILAVARAAGFEWMEALTLKKIGVFSMRFGNYDRATFSYEAALALARNGPDKHFLLEVLAELGHAWIELGNPKRGWPYLIEASDLFFTLEAKASHIVAVKVLAEHVPDNYRLDEVLTFLKKRKQAFYGSGMSLTMRIRIYLGIVLKRMGRIDEARVELKAAMDLSRDFESACLQADALLKMGELEGRAGRIELAGQYLNQALSASAECHDWMNKRKIHEALMGNFEQKSDFEQALAQQKDVAALDRKVLFPRVAERVERLISQDNIRELRRNIAEIDRHIEAEQHKITAMRNNEADRNTRRALREQALQNIRKELQEGVNRSRTQVQKAIRSERTALAADEAERARSVSTARHAGQDQQFPLVLARRFPDLTRREIIVAELLRHKKSTKEIAHILHISVRAAETYRFRIRRKMNLERGADLAQTLAEIVEQKRDA